MELSDLEKANDTFETLLFRYTTGEKVSMKEVDRAFGKVKREMRKVRDEALRRNR